MTEAQERIAELERYLKVEKLSFETRLWIRKEIWAIKIATARTVA